LTLPNLSRRFELRTSDYVLCESCEFGVVDMSYLVNESVFLAGFFSFIGGSKIGCLLCRFTEQGTISNVALQCNKGASTNGALL
jgi:hypothetical protein